MSDGFEWGPWIDHDGKGRPVPDGTLVEIVVERHPGMFFQRVGIAGSGFGLSWNWSWWLKPAPDDGLLVSRIIRYRIRRPRAVEDLARLCANPYAPPPVIGPDGPVSQQERVPA